MTEETELERMSTAVEALVGCFPADVDVTLVAATSDDPDTGKTEVLAWDVIEQEIICLGVRKLMGMDGPVELPPPEP
jgi:hypothetical protein